MSRYCPCVVRFDLGALVADSAVKVLFGDSTPSELEPDVLDLVSEVVSCASEVGRAYAEIDDLRRRQAEALRVTAAIREELERFAKQTEVGLRATASAFARPEVRDHGEEVIDTIGRLVDGWRRHYEQKLETTKHQINVRGVQLKQEIFEALQRFLLPRRTRSTIQWSHRFFDGSHYQDTVVVEPLPGIRTKLVLADPEPEIPRRLRSLVGKGARVQVGTRRSRLRRVEEPVYVSLDDMLLLDVETSPGRLRILMAKKAGTADALRLELVLGDDGPRGTATRAEGSSFTLPASDAAVLQALIDALQGEWRRIVAGSAVLTELALDGREVEDSSSMIDVAERLVEIHRGVVAQLARHSPNPEELTIKVERDGKREETWIRRDELAQHLLSLPGELRQRLGMSELYEGADDLADARTSSHAIIDAYPEETSSRISIEPVPIAAPGVPVEELTEDISLGDVLIDAAEPDDGCVNQTVVRSRSR